jgi:hypothetical protein
VAEQKVLSKDELSKIKRPKDTPVKVEIEKGRVPVFEIRGQTKGPIVAGVREWVVCTTCSRLFSTKEEPKRIGIRKRHAAKHLADHRMGRIRRPEPKA